MNENEKRERLVTTASAQGFDLEPAQRTGAGSGLRTQEVWGLTV